MTITSPWDDPDNEPEGTTREELIQLIEAQRNLVIAVGTGGPGIDTVDHVYKRRRAKLIRNLPRFGLSEPFRWGSLWDWYGHYSSTLPSYASRRMYVNELAQPVLDELLAPKGEVVDFGDAPASWGDLDARLEELKERVASAISLDDFQDVGRRCREVLRDAADLAYDPDMVDPWDDPPGDADVKGKIDAVLAARVPGESQADLRAVIRKVWALSNTVTHSSSIGRIDAFACAQATVMLVRVLGEIDKGDSGTPPPETFVPPPAPPPDTDEVPF